jgi:DNA-binding MarR family transcriptional regulator
MHFGMLTILDAEGPISQRELSLRTGVDPSSMVSRMDALEQQGMVERTRSATDRRSYEIRLTERGHDVLAELREAVDRQTERFFGVLDEDERRTLHELLTKVATDLDDSADPDAGPCAGGDARPSS